MSGHSKWKQIKNKKGAADAKRGSAGPMELSVGEVRDYTGKSSINEGANVTQGSTLMVMSALGRLDPHDVASRRGLRTQIETSGDGVRRVELGLVGVGAGAR